MIRSRSSPVERSAGDQAVHQLRALAGCERLEEERRRVHLPPAPAGPQIEQLGARDAQEEDRRVAREIRDVLDEVDEDGLGPLQVVDDDHLRALDGPCLEEAAERELRLGRRRADHGVGLGTDGDEDLDEWPVRDPLAVRETAAAEDIGRVADALEEVGDEPGLADPGRA